MEQKTQKKEKNKIEVEELLKYPELIEKELKYWIKERKISYMEKAMRSTDINIRFAGTYSLETMDLCFHPDDSDIMDLMYEEDEELVDNFSEFLNPTESG